MTFGLRIIAQMLMLLASIAVYGTLDALHARGGIVTSMVLVALLAFVAILFHELAHAAAAQLVGARVHAIVAFPFRLRFRPRRLDLIKRGAHRHGDLGGYVSYTLDRIEARRRQAIIAAAGPFANLALALMAAAMAPLFESPAWQRAVASAQRDTARHAAASTRGVDDLPDDRPVTLIMTGPGEGPAAMPILLLAFALLSGGLGLGNLIPYRGSDGDHILNLWRRA